MRHHFKILFLTFLIVCITIIISYYYFKNNLNEAPDFNLITYIIFMILCCFYPIGFYTCWRLIADEDYKGIFLYKHLIRTTGGMFRGVFFVPFILAPIFIPDYISYFKYDLKKYK